MMAATFTAPERRWRPLNVSPPRTDIGRRRNAVRGLRMGTIAAVLVASVLGALPASAAPPTAADAESSFVARINQLRAEKGVPPLTVDPELSSVARTWTARMVAAGDISHNPHLADAVTADWRKLGENVGMGPDVGDLFTAFVRSPHHYVNLVDPAFARVGVAVMVAPDGTLFTTHDFALVETPETVPTPPATAHLDAVLDQLRSLDAAS
jgi:uncharacterized protein YkwD